MGCTKKALSVAKKFKPDILIGSPPYLAYVSKLINKPYILLTDTEHANLVYWLTNPFVDMIISPDCFYKKFRTKHLKFKGYLELSYLHPNHFTPDSSVLMDLGLKKDERFFILRFVAWDASHDVGQSGISKKYEFIKKLEEYGKVFITSELKLDTKFEKYRITIPPEKIHDLLYYATMYIGEGASMACESAMLGVPAIYINSLRVGYLNELEDKYDLVYNFSNKENSYEQALSKAIELLDNKDLKSNWQTKRKKMINEKVDVTAWMIDLIENTHKNFIPFEA